MATPNFKKLLAGVSQGEVVIPILRAALWSPDFKGFNVDVPGFVHRDPDNWFHPSSHPRWPARMLYWYLVAPDKLVGEPFDPLGTMAVTQGHFWHGFTGQVLTQSKYLLGLEVGAEDRKTGARGKMDGVTRDEEVFELKTMNDRRLDRIEKGAPDDPAVVASFKKICPDYYYQGQEYMRLSGLQRWRGLIMSLSYPFPMREIVLDPDREVQHEIKEKYLMVRQAVADQRPPEPCCGGGKEVKSCFARMVCPVALGAL